MCVCVCVYIAIHIYVVCGACHPEQLTWLADQRRQSFDLPPQLSLSLDSVEIAAVPHAPLMTGASVLVWPHSLGRGRERERERERERGGGGGGRERN